MKGRMTGSAEIERTVLEQMIEHASHDYPRECCGLLSGRGKVIDEITRTANVKKSRTEFSISAQELITFMKSLRAASKEFLGIYHSHPRGPAQPSALDSTQFYYPAVSYWILSPQGEGWQARCFRWKDEAFHEVEFVVAGAGGHGRQDQLVWDQAGR